MIKVLEENEPALLVTCYACLSKFTLDKQDIKKLDNSGNIRGVHCPVCEEWTSEHMIQRVPKREIEIMIKRSDKNE